MLNRRRLSIGLVAIITAMVAIPATISSLPSVHAVPPNPILWAENTPIPYPTAQEGVIAGLDGRIYVMGGYSRVSPDSDQRAGNRNRQHWINLRSKRLLRLSGYFEQPNLQCDQQCLDHGNPHTDRSLDAWSCNGYRRQNLRGRGRSRCKRLDHFANLQSSDQTMVFRRSHDHCPQAVSDYRCSEWADLCHRWNERKPCDRNCRSIQHNREHMDGKSLLAKRRHGVWSNARS